MNNDVIIIDKFWNRKIVETLFDVRKLKSNTSKSYWKWNWICDIKNRFIILHNQIEIELYITLNASIIIVVYFLNFFALFYVFIHNAIAFALRWLTYHILINDNIKQNVHYLFDIKRNIQFWIRIVFFFFFFFLIFLIFNCFLRWWILGGFLAFINFF